MTEQLEDKGKHITEQHEDMGKYWNEENGSWEYPYVGSLEQLVVRSVQSPTPENKDAWVQKMGEDVQETKDSLRRSTKRT